MACNTARCSKIAKPETLVETLHVTSLQGLTEQYCDGVCFIDKDNSRSQEFTKDKFMEMAPEYDLATRQDVQEGIEKFRAELKAAKAEIQPTTKIADNPKILVAIATKGGGLVNQHFGHAKEFQVYEVDGSEVKYVGHRKIDINMHYQVIIFPN